MRVLLVSKAMLSATAQKKAELLACMPDVELTVVSPPYWRADDGGKQYIETGQPRGWKLVVAPMWLNGHFHVHAYPTLSRILRDISPNLVHIDEEPYNLATYHALRTARRAGARTLFVTWQNLYRSYPPPFSWMERYNYAHADYALAANDDAVAVLRRKGYRGPVSVFPQFGADTELFVPRAHASGQPLRVGYVGRLVPQKGVSDLVRAFAPLASRAELFIVGRGPTEPELRQLAAALGIAERVRFLGNLSSSDVATTMASFDLLVLPSLTLPNWAEQFGRVLVEAMACDVAVVGSSSGEIPRVIGGAGLVYPEGDIEALRSCLLQLADDPKQRAALAHAGRQRVLAHYTQDAIARATYDAWQAVLSRAVDPRAGAASH